MAPYDTDNPFPIKAWAEDDRPREKLLRKGSRTLSDAELLAVLMGSGTREVSAVSLARHILHHYHGNLQDLGRASPDELLQFRGVGEAKAVSILAALELGRRRQAAQARELPALHSHRDAAELLAPILADLDHEQFWLLLLNRANRVLAIEQVSSGGITGTVVDPKVIFRKALAVRATGIILAHNHPSGNLRPSQADIEITKRLKVAGEHLEIRVLDHLIITSAGHFSFADQDLLGP